MLFENYLINGFKYLSRPIGLGVRHYAKATAKPTDLLIRATVKPLKSRKTFLIDLYKNIMESHQLVVFVHYNNLMKNEDHFFRDKIKSTGGKLTKVRNNLFQVYLKNSNREDPCAPVQDKSKLVRNHPLASLFHGPTAAISYKDADSASLAKLIKLLDASKDKLFIIGAKIDSDVLDIDKIRQFSKLPPKPILQAQLVNILQQLGGVGLVNTLEAASKNLYLTLKSHEKNILDGETEN